MFFMLTKIFSIFTQKKFTHLGFELSAHTCSCLYNYCSHFATTLRKLTHQIHTYIVILLPPASADACCCCCCPHLGCRRNVQASPAVRGPGMMLVLVLALLPCSCCHQRGWVSPTEAGAAGAVAVACPPLHARGGHYLLIWRRPRLAHAAVAVRWASPTILVPMPMVQQQLVVPCSCCRRRGGVACCRS